MRRRRKRGRKRNIEMEGEVKGEEPDFWIPLWDLLGVLWVHCGPLGVTWVPTWSHLGSQVENKNLCSGHPPKRGARNKTFGFPFGTHLGYFGALWGLLGLLGSPIGTNFGVELGSKTFVPGTPFRRVPGTRLSTFLWDPFGILWGPFRPLEFPVGAF